MFPTWRSQARACALEAYQIYATRYEDLREKARIASEKGAPPGVLRHYRSRLTSLAVQKQAAWRASRDEGWPTIGEETREYWRLYHDGLLAIYVYWVSLFYVNMVANVPQELRDAIPEDSWRKAQVRRFYVDLNAIKQRWRMAALACHALRGGTMPGVVYTKGTAYSIEREGVRAIVLTPSRMWTEYGRQIRWRNGVSWPSLYRLRSLSLSWVSSARQHSGGSLRPLERWACLWASLSSYLASCPSCFFASSSAANSSSSCSSPA